MKLKLTKAVIEAAIKKNKRDCLWDTTIKGLYAEIQPNRSNQVSCSYRLRYTFNRKKQTVTLGSYELLSLDEVRTKAKDTLIQIHHGNDPAKNRNSITLEQLSKEYYLPHITLTKKSWRSDESLLRHHILPALGILKLTEITTQDIIQLQQSLIANKYEPGTNNRVITAIKHIFKLCLKLWKIPGLTANPATDVTLLKLNNQRQTFLEPAQIERLLDECRKNSQQSPYLPYIIALIALTGVRKSNALWARWCEFDEAHQTWTIPVTKSGKAQTIHLAHEAMELLKALPSRGQSEWLFPNPKTQKPYRTIFVAWNTARKRAGLSHVRIHDLRHTFASLLINSGHSLYVVQKALGHHSPTMTMRYAHLADQTLKEANNAVGSLVKSGIDRLIAP